MDSQNPKDNAMLMELTSDVVSSYVSNNPIAAGDLSTLIKDVYNALDAVSGSAQEPVVEKQKPAVSIKKSLGREYLICLEDGKKFKSLKRHLKTHYDLSPEEYREKWGLPADYPMVAPAYAEERSRLAKEMGLGQKRRAK
ncbi:MAG: MucR family transcriptional regulator [Ahrensia sp.]|nr:MucR family transcriptional regulator [Ahrensia sp.]